jgi:23S rRNA (uracil1939-C5)-methyltransferase
MPDELTLLIEKLVYGGDGLAHSGGNAVFVPYVLPGENVRASVRVAKKKLVKANLLEVVSHSKERIAAPCPHFGVCGGCHYQHISQSEQVRLKKEILRETLSRLGGITWAGEVVAHSGEAYGYRNRAQWAVRPGLPRALGYFLPESTTIVPIDSCALLSPGLAKTFLTLQDWVRSGRFPSEVSEIEAFADSSDTRIALNVACSRFAKSAKELAKEFRNALPELESLLLLDEKTDRFDLTGPGFLTHEAGGFRYRVSHLSFFQVNRFLIAELLRRVIGESKGGFALDLYSGVGFFTLPLAKAFERVVSVDANLAATRDLQANAEAAGVKVDAHNVHVADFLKTFREKPELIVLDPPRNGLGPEATAKLAKLGAGEIVYLSCDPATLARDLAILMQSTKDRESLREAGARYEIVAMDFFDLFPQTYHIETLVRLRLAR